MERPLILITNDDGYASKGIRELIKMAQCVGNVLVVAPAEGQSGKSHAVSIGSFVRMKKLQDDENLTIYSVTGTPVDCLKMALGNILTRKPDILISGINHGSNSSVNAFYSGTMGAAREGAFNGIPSIGLSLCDYDADADFSVVIKHSEPLIKKVLSENKNPNLCLNVNFPKVTEAEFKGLRICRQAYGVWKESFVENTDPYGGKIYWLTGNFENAEPTATDTDEWALANNFAPVVPMNLDSTDFVELQNISYLI